MKLILVDGKPEAAVEMGTDATILDIGDNVSIVHMGNRKHAATINLKYKGRPYEGLYYEAICGTASTEVAHSKTTNRVTCAKCVRKLKEWIPS